MEAVAPRGDRGSAAVAPIVLDPAAPAIGGYRVVLAGLARDLDDSWQGTIDRTAPELLHQLRIAVRRTRSVLASSRGVVPAEVRDDALRGFRHLSDLTGRPRDLDVYLIGWSAYLAPLDLGAVSDLAPVHALLETHRDEAYDRLIEGMRSREVRDRLDTWVAWLERPLDGTLQPRARKPLGQVVAKRIRAAHHTVLREGRAIEAWSTDEVLHRLRKDAKQLRYLLECFGGLLEPGAQARSVKRLKKLQENLGEHQDAAVHLAELGAIARTIRPTESLGTMVAVEDLMRQLLHVQRVTRDQFADRFAAYDKPSTSRAMKAALRGICA